MYLTDMSFSFCSEKFVTFFLTQMLFRSVLFGFQILRDFSEIFLLLISNSVPLVSVDKLCMTLLFWVFFFFLVFCYRIWSILSLFYMHLKECLFCCLLGCPINVKLIDSVFQVFYIIIDFLSSLYTNY